MAKGSGRAHSRAASSGLHGQEVCRALSMQKCESVLARDPQSAPVLVVHNDDAALQGFQSFSIIAKGDWDAILPNLHMSQSCLRLIAHVVSQRVALITSPIG